MSATKILCAATALLALASPALVQRAAPCDLREANASVPGTQGKTWSTRMAATSWTWQ